jgi:putative endonuclease
MNNNTAGHLAESMAHWFMRLKGYRIVTCNQITGKGTHAGEVDFIVRRGRTLVFVEVKKRSSLERAAYAIKPAQQQRIRNGAAAFLKKNPQFADFDIRFDAILITFPCSIEHIENAF